MFKIKIVDFVNYMQQDTHEFLNFHINHVNKIIVWKGVRIPIIPNLINSIEDFHNYMQEEAHEFFEFPYQSNQ